MCKQVSYSKYQKRVIKFLTEFLGTATPFSYERTQTNHLKVLIEGVPKPLYTASTPSDIKSFNNFVAEVKREVRVAMGDVLPQTESSAISRLPQVGILTPEALEKLIQTCIKMLRARLEVMRSREEARVLEAGQVEMANHYRLDEAKQAIKLALQARKSLGYIKSKEMKAIEIAVVKHLNFMLPTLAQYAELISDKPKLNTSVCSPVSMGGEPLQVKENVPVKSVEEHQAVAAKTLLQPALSRPPEKRAPHSPSQVPTQNQMSDSARQLMAMGTNDRLSLLRRLTKPEAERLIADIQQAIVLNLEEDIASVVAFMREKAIPLDAIIAQYEAA